MCDACGETNGDKVNMRVHKIREHEQNLFLKCDVCVCCETNEDSSNAGVHKIKEHEQICF